MWSVDGTRWSCGGASDFWSRGPISNPLILAPATTAATPSGAKRLRAGCVDGSNVVAGSPGVYCRI